MFSPGETLSDDVSHAVEITVISAEGLTLDRKPVRNKAYAIVRTDNDGSWSASRIDHHSGHSPKWNEKLLLDMPRRLRDVVVEVCQRGSSRDRIVGGVRIPVSDFTGEYSVPALNHLHFLSYRLRDAKGLKNGIINVSIRVTLPASMPEAPASTEGVCPGYSSGSHQGTAVAGFPEWYAETRKSRRLEAARTMIDQGATDEFATSYERTSLSAGEYRFY